MKPFRIFLLAITLPLLASAQEGGQAAPAYLSPAMQQALSTIRSNNTTLSSLRAKSRLDAEDARTDAALPDPEVGFGRHWGSAEDMLPRRVVDVTQELDWGILSGRRSRTTEAGRRAAEAEYVASAREVMLEAERTLINLVHANRLCVEMQARLDVARRITALYEQRLERGDVSRMEVNKVRLSQASAVATAERAEADRIALLANLARLNGGQSLEFKDTTYVSVALPSLDEILTRAETLRPEMSAAASALERDRSQLKPDRTAALPNLSVGYSGELIKGASYNGINFGLTIPLWGRSRQRVRRAEAAVTLAEVNLADARTTVLASVKEQYGTATRLLRSTEELRESLAATNNAEAQAASLRTGQISLTEYLQEITFYYSAREALFLAERDSRLALVGLY